MTARIDPVAILMGASFSLIWASAFSFSRLIVLDASPLFSLSARFAVSGLMAIAIAKAMGGTLRIPRSQWRPILIFGLCQNALYLGLAWSAMQTVEASLGAIIASTTPLIVALANRVLFDERLGRLGIAGLVAGFAGVALIMGSRLTGGAEPLGVLMLVGAALALSSATLVVRGATGAGGNLMAVVGLQMLVGGAILLPIAAVLEAPRVAFTGGYMVGMAYSILVSGIFATWLWFRLIGRIGATRAATFHFLNPVFGVIVAALLLSEPVRALDAVGVAIVTAGILAVQLSRIRRR